jgi:crotonobetainyl-CoA:carnitine CoA-transferase CaiB-like acyl-CoA transferase
VISGSGDEAAYSGLRVYDATQGVAGPHCTMLLALQGADVIKVEPTEGDWMRNAGNRIGDHSSHSLAYNRAKRSVALDLRRSEARAVARRLAASCDIVVENFRPGTMKKLGLDYETLSAKRPELVYCSVSGFGQVGPYSGDPAIDTVMQAFAGWMHVNRDGTGKPQVLDLVAIDILTGLYAFNTVAALVLRRFRFGRGGYADVNMLQSSAAFLAQKLIDHHRPMKEGMVMFSPPNGEFATADGTFIVSVTRQDHFYAVCRAIGREDIANDPRFGSRPLRIENGKAMLAALEPEFASRTGADLHRAFREAGALGSPVQDFSALLGNEQVRAMNLVPGIDIPGYGTIPSVHIPGTTHPADAPDLARVAHLGEHTAEVLAEQGYSAAEIAALAQSGAAKLWR